MTEVSDQFRGLWNPYVNLVWSHNRPIKLANGQRANRNVLLLEKHHIGLLLTTGQHILKKDIQRDSLLIVDTQNETISTYVVANGQAGYEKECCHGGILEKLSARKSRRAQAGATPT
jgi:hypothetical protein